jgi:hypothetical protein
MGHWAEKYIRFDDHLTWVYEIHEGPKCSFAEYLDFVLQL